MDNKEILMEKEPVNTNIEPTEKEFLEEPGEILTANEEAAEEPKTETPPAPTRRTRANRANEILSDGNQLINTDWYNTQNAAVKKIKTAIKGRNICFGTVYGTELREDKSGLKILIKFDETLRVIIPDYDFFAHSDMKNIENDDAETRIVRYQRKAIHCVNGAVSFLPLAIQEDEYGVPYVIASRKMAMDMNQNRFFFGRNPVAAVDKVATASIISTGPRYIIVECLGLEITMGTGELSAFEYIEDASKKFKIGDGLPVVIKELKVDREKRKVDIKLSHAEYELRESHKTPIDEKMLGGRYGASVVAVTENHYVLIINQYKARGLVSLNDYYGTDPLVKGDKVVLLVTKINKEKNLVYGRCMKID